MNGDVDIPVTTVDGLLPPEIAAKAEDVGVAKGRLPLFQLFLLAVLAGAFISMGCVFYVTTVTNAQTLAFGVKQMLGGLAFCLGLVLVVVGGAELFTGNTLLVMATVSKKLPLSKLLLNWAVVYAGNFVGSLATAYLMFLSQQYTMADGGVGETTLAIATAKCELALIPALVRGIYCNALVCLAVWLTYSCRTTTDKIVAIIFPITAFVAAGFEHCVANMYLIPLALFLKSAEPALAAPTEAFEALTWRNFLIGNLMPVTIGNIIGGSVFVGAVYWMVYCWPARGRR
jgi:formate/nitrite transporter